MGGEAWIFPKVYAVKHTDESVRAASRSGGIFTAISDSILDDGGIVYGCVLSDDFKAVHIRAEDKAGRDAMRGSKYIQSKLGDTYKNIKVDLDAGRIVLFSGTSCQVDGLRMFLGRDYDNLFCVDIVCHGVPSTAVWNAYLRWQEKMSKAKVTAIDFRNKRDFGWRDHVETIKLDNGEQVSSRVFRTLFLGHTILRPSCYECPFKSVMHPGDVTIADYWGIEKAAPEFDDNKGVSLVLANNDKGEDTFERIKKNLIWKQNKLEDSMQPPLKAPFPKPKNREQFWRDFQNREFGYIAKKYGGEGFTNKIKGKLSGIKRRVVRLVK